MILVLFVFPFFIALTVLSLIGCFSKNNIIKRICRMIVFAVPLIILRILSIVFFNNYMNFKDIEAYILSQLLFLSFCTLIVMCAWSLCSIKKRLIIFGICMGVCLLLFGIFFMNAQFGVNVNTV
jgi:hypothetical protein